MISPLNITKCVMYEPKMCAGQRLSRVERDTRLRSGRLLLINSQIGARNQQQWINLITSNRIISYV